MKTASIYNEITFKENKPAITVLMETDFTKEIRIAFQEGQLMKEHTAPFPIVVEIVDGSIDFGVDGSVQKLKKGDLISLAGKVPHDLKASEQSIVRLTLSKKDNAQRVQEVPAQ